MKAVLVIPCYNEEARLRVDLVGALLTRLDLSVRFVDDGSTDRTPQILSDIRDTYPGRVLVQRLDKNVGKSKAVARGLRSALKRPDVAALGYADADFATPARELLRLLERLEAHELDAVWGARVALMGSNIRRSLMRHLLGRVFATAAALALGEVVYDTQCGAKWFRRTPVLEAALEHDFDSNWAFDVELFGRLFGAFGAPSLDRARCQEVALESWTDVPESKVTLPGMVESLADLGFLWAKRKRFGRRR